METKTYKTIDRAAVQWPSGPWDGEPDKMQWPDADTGLPCLAVRHGSGGHWCGYVGVAEGHALFGKENPEDGYLDVHGGITFGDFCRPGAEEIGVCHIPGEGEPDHVWWLGFDCAHSGDYRPADAKYAIKYEEARFQRGDGEVYRSLEYVRSECARLAKQLV